MDETRTPPAQSGPQEEVPNYTFLRLSLSDYAYQERVTGFAMLVFVEKGWMRVVINGTEYEADDHDFLFIFPRSTVRLVDQKDCEVAVVGFLMQLQESVTMHISPNFFMAIMYQTKWTMDDTALKAARAFCTLFEFNVCHGVSEISADVASTLMSLFIQMFYHKLKGQIPTETKAVTILNRSLWWRFIDQVGQHYKEHHDVNFYANQLCVSSKYLTQIVKRVTQVTPKTVIDHRLAGESVYLLAKTRASIQEISDKLGFPDQSYFGRFFKRNFGVSPLAFRLKPDLRLLAKINVKITTTEETLK